MNKDLIKYIKDNVERGFPEKEIKDALTRAGWKKEDIKAGFKDAGVKRSKIKLGKLLPVVIVIIVILAGLFALYRFSTWLDFLK